MKDTKQCKIPSDLHRSAKIDAMMKGITLEEWLKNAIRKALPKTAKK